MRSHFHAVVETPSANLVGGMQSLLSTYTLRLNHRRKLIGHLFSGGYKPCSRFPISGSSHRKVHFLGRSLHFGISAVDFAVQLKPSLCALWLHQQWLVVLFD